MKPSLVLALALAATACSTTETPQTRATYSSADDAAMSAVESTASNRGVRVYWVNPPRKPETTQPGG